MEFFAKPQIVINFAKCPPDIASNMERTVMTVFECMGTDCTSIILLDARAYPFPVMAVDEYLRRNPEKGRKVTELYLQFSDSNSVQLLEMVRKRFSNIKSLKLPHSFTHPIEHALGQYAQMPNLETIHFGYSAKELAEYAQTNDLMPLPQVKSLFCCMVSTTDTYEDFEDTLPIIFPNLETLYYTGPVLAEQIKANAKRLFPKMKFCKMTDSSKIPSILLEQENPQFPINVAGKLKSSYIHIKD